MAEVVVIGNIAMELLHSLQYQFMTLTVRTPEGSPVVNLREQVLNREKAWRQEEIQEVISRCPPEEPIFAYLSERQSRCQQDQWDGDLRIFLVEVEFSPLADLQLHRF